jgi:serine/threonine protein kinase
VKDTAVKVIDYSDSKDQEKAIVDLKREYHNLESLDHPSIVRFLGFTHNELAKQAIIQMEWAATELSESPAGCAALDLADLINQHSDNYK